MLCGIFINSGFNIWVLIELNFLIFLGYLHLFLFSRKEILLYFLIQAWRRIILFIFYLFLINNLFQNLRVIFVTISLILKLGRAPLHFWYILIIQKISWQRIWLLSIWQKILPLFFLRLFKLTFLIYIGIFNCILSRFFRFKQKKIKKLLGFSSIFTLGWVMTIISEINLLWLFFLLGYGLNLFFLICRLKINNQVKLKALISELDFNRFLLLGFTLIAVRGIPPFLRFFLKVIVLKELILIYFFSRVILVITRILLIYAYLSILFYNLRFSIGKQIFSTIFSNFYYVRLVGINLLGNLFLWELVY